jgi:hypothetical protein
MLLLCPQLGDEAVLAIAKHCPLLEHVLLPEATIPVVACCVHLKHRPTGSGWPREEWVQGLVVRRQFLWPSWWRTLGA